MWHVGLAWCALSTPPLPNNYVSQIRISGEEERYGLTPVYFLSVEFANEMENNLFPEYVMQAQVHGK